MQKCLIKRKPPPVKIDRAGAFHIQKGAAERQARKGKRQKEVIKRAQHQKRITKREITKRRPPAKRISWNSFHGRTLSQGKFSPWKMKREFITQSFSHGKDIIPRKGEHRKSNTPKGEHQGEIIKKPPTEKADGVQYIKREFTKRERQKGSY